MKRLVHRASSSWLPILTLLALLSACGGSSTTPPAVPTGLTAAGSLGKITLSWTSGGPVVGHNIYRSADNVAFLKMNGDKVGGTSYVDNIASPAGDGVFYYYRITAVDTVESNPSATVRSIHGTRLVTAPPYYPAGFTTDNTLSPYVLEGTTFVDNGSFVIGNGAKLYLLDNAVLDVAKGHGVTVNGLLRVLAANGASHATITASPRVGAPLSNGEGFSITFFGAVNFNPADNSGTWLRNTLLSNLMSSQAVRIQDCSPGFANCKLVANDNIGTSYFEIDTGGGPIVRNCSFDNMSLGIYGGNPSTTTLAIDNNVFANSYYAVSFWSMAGPGVSAGQIANNVFDGRKTAYLWNVTGAAVPLDNNFWSGAAAVPTITPAGFSTSTYSFYPVLYAAPSSAGPNW